MIAAPGSDEPRRELTGHIMIYDGFIDDLIAAAMARNFAHMDSGMFSALTVTDSHTASCPEAGPVTGNYITKNDVCDRVGA